MPALLLKAESLAILIGAIAFYARFEGNWLLFIVLLFAPDLSMLGYLAGPTVGRATYNAAHTYAVPVLLAVVGVLTESDGATEIGLVWTAHIGIDRALGYGLKYRTGFKDTHLQRV